MSLAKEHQCESVAFPLISAGTFGYPKDEALSVALDVISRFLFANDMMIYNIYEINEVLFDYDMPLLGTSMK